MLNWCNRFNICCFLDNHNYHLSHHSVECLAAAGAHRSVTASAGNAFSVLRDFQRQQSDWLFGHLGYDLKNETEQLTSRNPDRIGFPDLFFFVPQVILQLNDQLLTIGSLNDDHEHILEQITSADTRPAHFTNAITDIRHRYTRDEYIAVVDRLQQHILRGDCYEINFCQEFFADNVSIDPLSFYITLSEASPNPFSAYYKQDEHFLLCMSPERYLKKEGNQLFSQPIKGTSRRVPDDPRQDEMNRQQLLESEKERAENIMVVDLVRNDLSRICRHGSVQVDELCQVYSFPFVHQMTSTITGTLDDAYDWIDAVKATFPMGSMTGAPKKRVMELIEQYEITRRGLFSGAIGYVTPDLDFDFNVVIRSVLYNAADRYLSFHSGSAITFNSDPAQEYEECLLKAQAIKKALAETNTFH